MAPRRTWGWLVDEKGIEPHIPVFDKSARDDGSFERADFIYTPEDDSCLCPGQPPTPVQSQLQQAATGIDKDGSTRYRSRQQDCQDCIHRHRCTPHMPARKVTRSIHEAARDVARDIATTDAYVVSRRQRKKVEMLFAHLKRILKLDRLRLRGPNGAKDEFHLAAAAQNLRRMAKMISMPGAALACSAAGACSPTCRITCRSLPSSSSSTEYAAYRSLIAQLDDPGSGRRVR